MSITKQPLQKPKNNKFSAGPAAKFTGYNINEIDLSILGRSFRSKEAGTMLKEVIVKIKKILNIPEDYKLIFTPGSGTGAFELALWNLIGPNKVDVLSWDGFGYMWQEDIEKEFLFKSSRFFKSEFGSFPDISEVDFKNNDIVFTYCGTTSGVIFNREDLLQENRNGLVITDATSYVFSEDIPWQKIDALTFSLQKCIGGEAQTGILVLSPKAIARVNSYTPSWPIPHLFRIKQNGQIKETLLDSGSPINTVSLFTIADCLYILNWIEKNGGINFTKNKISDNFNVMTEWVKKSQWLSFLPKDLSFSSKVAVCLQINHPSYLALPQEKQKELVQNILELLKNNKVAYDISSHFKAPIGFRIWCGTTIDKEDLSILTEWLDYCFYSLIKKI